MKKYLVLLSISLLLLSSLLACGGAAEPTEAPEPAEPAGEIALKILGIIEHKTAWTEAEIRAMETMDVEATNKDGETNSYTGVSINKLLEVAGPAADATAVEFVADDGYAAEVTLAEVQGCADCIVSFRDEGGFSIGMPGFSSKVQVKGVVEIQVK